MALRTTRSARHHTPTRGAFALWDLETGNLVGAYETEAAALAVVRHALEQDGPESVVMLGLARETPGRTRTIAQGQALAERALAAVPGAPGSPTIARTPMSA